MIKFCEICHKNHVHFPYGEDVVAHRDDVGYNHHFFDGFVFRFQGDECPNCGNKNLKVYHNLVQANIAIYGIAHKYDNTDLLDWVESIEQNPKIKDILVKECDDLAQKIIDGNYKREYYNSLNTNSLNYNTIKQNIPTCPRCNSTSITTGPRGVSGFWGFIGASKTVNRCAICGYTWKPSI